MSDAISVPPKGRSTEKNEQPNPFISMADRHDLLAAMADKSLRGFDTGKPDFCALRASSPFN